MNDVICPNCHSVTPPLRHCLACNYCLEKQLSELFRDAPAKSEWSLSKLLALAWYEAKRLLTPTGRLRKFSVHMDGRLRRDCRRIKKDGIQNFKPFATEEPELAIIAKVDHVDEFKKHVKRVTTTIKRHPHDQTALVTARIQADENKIEWLRNQPYVKSLKASTRIRPVLEQTRREIFHDAGLLKSHHEAKGGGGVIIGIVDFGLDFAHKNFRIPKDCTSKDHASKDCTRILALWDQKAPDRPDGRPEAFKYGRVFEKDEINRALEQDDPYEALGYKVSKGGNFDESAHGTFVADLAAGNGRGTGCPGVAPEADIVFVDISPVGSTTLGAEAVNNSFGDCAQLQEAIEAIFAYAKDRPCVINISLGTNGGPHDGTTPVEEAMDWLLTQQEVPGCEQVPNRAIVVAAGNSFDRSLHAMGRVPEGGSVDLKWLIPRFDATSNELEVWYSGCDRFTVDLIDPDGNCVRRIKPGRIWEKTIGKKGLMTIVNRLAHPNNKDATGNQDNTINVFFERGVREGIWTLRLRGDSVLDGSFHAWIERDDYGQSKFVKPKDGSYKISNEYTLSSIACGRETIVVGSYDAYEPDLPMSEFSSSGPTRDKRKQPTVCAPGENVLAAKSRSLVLRHRQSGTSVAAAVVTGTVALMFSEAKRRKMSPEQVRSILIRTAHKDSASDNVWDPEDGYGRVCASKAVEDVRREAKGHLHQSSVAISGGEVVTGNGVITRNGRKG